MLPAKLQLLLFFCSVCLHEEKERYLGMDLHVSVQYMRLIEKKKKDGDGGVPMCVWMGLYPALVSSTVLQLPSLGLERPRRMKVVCYLGAAAEIHRTAHDEYQFICCVCMCVVGLRWRRSRRRRLSLSDVGIAIIMIGICSGRPSAKPMQSEFL